jgi:anthranilate synthase component 2
MTASICILDNYDSFTYNLVQLVREEAKVEPDVVRNDKIDLSELDKYESIILSPGPGLPSEAGIMPKLVKKYAETKKILGICLGHQCIAEVYGATLSNMEEVKHGKGIKTYFSEIEDPIFSGIESGFQSARYHSWCVTDKNLPKEVNVLAKDDTNTIMALKIKDCNVRGLQFHPESILTDCGAKIINNWINLC